MATDHYWPSTQTGQGESVFEWVRLLFAYTFIRIKCAKRDTTEKDCWSFSSGTVCVGKWSSSDRHSMMSSPEKSIAGKPTARAANTDEHLVAHSRWTLKSESIMSSFCSKRDTASVTVMSVQHCEKATRLHSCKLLRPSHYMKAIVKVVNVPVAKAIFLSLRQLSVGLCVPIDRHCTLLLQSIKPSKIWNSQN